MFTDKKPIQNSDTKQTNSASGAIQKLTVLLRAQLKEFGLNPGDWNIDWSTGQGQSNLKAKDLFIFKGVQIQNHKDKDLILTGDILVREKKPKHITADWFDLEFVV